MISPLPDHLDINVNTGTRIIEFHFDRNLGETDGQFLTRCLNNIKSYLEDANLPVTNITTIDADNGLQESTDWQSGDTLDTFLRRHYTQVLGA